MSKFIVEWSKGKICSNCAEQIKEDLCIKLSQNRWANPCICKNCLEELLSILNGKPKIRPKNKKIIYEVETISKNGWMLN